MKKVLVFVLMALLTGMTACAPKASRAAQTSSPAQEQAALQPAAKSGGMSLDEALAQAAARIEERIAAGSKIALLNFSSHSDRFSSYVLDELTANLVDSRKLVVVDRKEIDLIRDELKFQFSGEVEDNSIQEAGRLLGVSSIVSGSLTEIGEDYRIVIRVLNVQSASVEVQYRTDISSDRRVLALLEGGKSGAASVSGTTSASAGQAVPVMPASAHSAAAPVADENTFADPRDGQTYRTVKIGKLTWMAENLNFRPRSGNTWCYGNDNSNCDKYGRLYTWDAAKSACPAGWRLPANEDWNDLVGEADGKDAAGGMLKSKTDWDGTDEFGFSALPGGSGWSEGFNDAGGYGFWWSATEGGSGQAWGRGMGSGDNDVNEFNDDKGSGYSVRCVR